LKQQINQILARHTGQTIKRIEQDTERDFFMVADDAKKYGIIDKIL
jgi:ATP-dependent Clp protease protease subunit